MTPEEKRAGLRRMRIIATGLLVLMAVLLMVARRFVPAFEWLEYVAAFAEAAMVGALADWFAVVALFRHPLGIPIWHTAIIPRKKEAIGRALSNFVIANFLTREQVGKKLQDSDFGGVAARWLSENQKLVVDELMRFIPRFLNLMKDDDVQRVLHERLLARLKTVEVAPLAGNLLALLTSGNKQNALLNEALSVTAALVAENRDFIRSKIFEEIPLPDWGAINPLKDKIADFVADRVVEKIQQAVAEVMADPQHHARQTFQRKLEQLVIDLKSSAEYRKKGEALKQEILADPVLGQYVSEVWSEIKQMILEDLAKPDSAIRGQLESMVAGLSAILREDEPIRSKLNVWLKSQALDLVEQHKSKAKELIEHTMQKWNPAEVTQKIELEVGRDLQFIRLNGTIVGGLAGVLLHVLSEVLGK